MTHQTNRKGRHWTRDQLAFLLHCLEDRSRCDAQIDFYTDLPGDEGRLGEPAGQTEMPPPSTQK